MEAQILTFPVQAAAPVVAEVATFKTGQTYSCRSVCDYNCVLTFEVIKRTANRVWLRRQGGTVVSSFGVKVLTDGEVCFPIGRYSMAPILRA